MSCGNCNLQTISYLQLHLPQIPSCRKQASPPMLMIKRLDQSYQMRSSSHDNQNMEDLVARADDIILPRRPFLRYPRSVNRSTENVQSALSHNPIQTSRFAHMRETIESNTMEHGKYSRQAHEDEHECAKWAEGRRAEFRMCGYDCGTCCQSRDLKMNQLQEHDAYRGWFYSP
jgi:hypothetical protein